VLVLLDCEKGLPFFREPVRIATACSLLGALAKHLAFSRRETANEIIRKGERCL